MKYRDQVITDAHGNKKKNIIINGTTTVVYGEANPEEHVTQQIADKLWKAFEVLPNDKIVTRGVAKLHPDDTYDEKTGVIIASRKAELKARIKMYNSYLDVINILNDTIGLVGTELDKIADRIKAVCEELNIDVDDGTTPEA